MDFSSKIKAIERNHEQGDYTIVVKESISLIEAALRKLFTDQLTRLSDQDRLAVQKAENEIGKNTQTISQFNLAQLVSIMRKTRFIDAWAKATGAEPRALKVIDLNELTLMNDQFIHDMAEASRQDAELITHCLRVMLQSFEIEGKFKDRVSHSPKPAHPRNECLVITPEGNSELDKIFDVFVKPQFELKEMKLVLNHLQISENTDFRDILDPIQHARIILVLFDQASIILTYILGMVHSMNANVITLLQGVDQLPFYLKKANCLIYENTATGGKDLENALKMILERPDEAFEQYRNPLAEFLESGRLVKESPEFRQLYRDLESTHQIVRDIERKNDELETEKKGLEQQLADLQKDDPRRLKDQIDQLEGAKAIIEQQLAQSQTDNQRLTEQNERLSRQNETLQAEVDRLNTRFVFKKVDS